VVGDKLDRDYYEKDLRDRNLVWRSATNSRPLVFRSFCWEITGESGYSSAAIVLG
jgi:hypothetical protein